MKVSLKIQKAGAGENCKVNVLTLFKQHRDDTLMCISGWQNQLEVKEGDIVKIKGPLKEFKDNINLLNNLLETVKCQICYDTISEDNKMCPSGSMTWCEKCFLSLRNHSMKCPNGSEFFYQPNDGLKNVCLSAVISVVNNIMSNKEGFDKEIKSEADQFLMLNIIDINFTNIFKDLK